MESRIRGCTLIPAFVLFDGNISSEAIVCLMLIIYKYNEAGKKEVSISHSEFGKLIGINARNTMKYVHELSERKLIEVRQQTGYPCLYKPAQCVLPRERHGNKCQEEK